MDKKNVVLFAMTGMGNNALDVLLKMRDVELVAVFTPKQEAGPFPYYQCLPLSEAVLNHKGIQLFEDISLRTKAAYQTVTRLSPDVIVVSTFNQIIPQKIISIPRFGVINLHPSLLPKYRGPTPTVWALMNGEQETGVTAHLIEDERVDTGRIITQSRMKIYASDTDGMLRYRLASLSEKVLKKALRMVLTGKMINLTKQVESEASYYPKRTKEDAEINLKQSFETIWNQIRAMTPYPGAYVNYCGKKYLIRHISRNFKHTTLECFNGSKDKRILLTSDGVLKFIAKKKIQNG